MEAATRDGDWRVEYLEPLTIKHKSVITTLFTAANHHRDAEYLAAWQVVRTQTVFAKHLLWPSSLGLLAPTLW